MELATNVFLRGLSMDSHPIVMNNDGLTDALNATFVTSGENLMVLQNDMGNVKVDHAKLPPGYIPVGIKEYGGIIYVASYNPITHRSQIGSFPSPERLKGLDYTNDIGFTFESFFSDDNIYQVFETLFDSPNNDYYFFKNISYVELLLTLGYMKPGDEYKVIHEIVGDAIIDGLDKTEPYQGAANTATLIKNGLFTVDLGVLDSVFRKVDYDVLLYLNDSTTEYVYYNSNLISPLYVKYGITSPSFNFSYYIKECPIEENGIVSIPIDNGTVSLMSDSIEVSKDGEDPVVYDKESLVDTSLDESEREILKNRINISESWAKKYPMAPSALPLLNISSRRNSPTLEHIKMVEITVFYEIDSPLLFKDYEVLLFGNGCEIVSTIEEECKNEEIKENMPKKRTKTFHVVLRYRDDDILKAYITLGLKKGDKYYCFREHTREIYIDPNNIPKFEKDLREWYWKFSDRKLYLQYMDVKNETKTLKITFLDITVLNGEESSLDKLEDIIKEFDINNGISFFSNIDTSSFLFRHLYEVTFETFDNDGGELTNNIGKRFYLHTALFDDDEYQTIPDFGPWGLWPTKIGEAFKTEYDLEPYQINHILQVEWDGTPSEVHSLLFSDKENFDPYYSEKSYHELSSKPDEYRPKWGEEIEKKYPYNFWNKCNDGKIQIVEVDGTVTPLSDGSFNFYFKKTNFPEPVLSIDKVCFQLCSLEDYLMDSPSPESTDTIKENFIFIDPTFHAGARFDLRTPYWGYKEGFKYPQIADFPRTIDYYREINKSNSLDKLLYIIRIGEGGKLRSDHNVSSEEDNKKRLNFLCIYGYKHPFNNNVYMGRLIGVFNNDPNSSLYFIQLKSSDPKLYIEDNWIDSLIYSNIHQKEISKTIYYIEIADTYSIPYKCIGTLTSPYSNIELINTSKTLYGEIKIQYDLPSNIYFIQKGQNTFFHDKDKTTINSDKQYYFSENIYDSEHLLKTENVIKSRNFPIYKDDSALGTIYLHKDFGFRLPAFHGELVFYPDCSHGYDKYKGLECKYINFSYIDDSREGVINSEENMDFKGVSYKGNNYYIVARYPAMFTYKENES